MVEFNPIRKHLFPIHVVNWIFGIGIAEYPAGHPHPIYSLIYTFVWLTFFCTICLFNHQEMIEMVSVPRIRLPIQILFFSQMFMTISTMILGWFRSKALNECVMKASLVDYMMGEIGLDSNSKRLIKAQIWNMIPSTLHVIFMMVMSSSVVIIEDLPLIRKLAFGVAINYPTIILYIADLTFTNIVSCITYRFEELNRALESLTTEPTKPFQYRLEKAISSDIKKINLAIADHPTKNHAHIIEKARHIHLQLSKICGKADQMYGLQILLSIIVAFLVLIGDTYMVYIILVEVRVSQDEFIKSTVASFIWCTYHIVKIMKFSSVCSYCVQQSIKTGDIINRLYNEHNTNSETKSEIRNFNVQLIISPIKFTAYGFVDLDYSLVTGMITSITTYLMILIQLGKLPSITSIKHNFFKIFDNITANNN